METTTASRRRGAGGKLFPFERLLFLFLSLIGQALFAADAKPPENAAKVESPKKAAPGPQELAEKHYQQGSDFDTIEGILGDGGETLQLPCQESWHRG